MITILLFFAVVAVTAVLFVAWLVGNGVRSVFRLAVGRESADDGTPDQPRCRNPGCRTANPAHARFCRRCGAAMGVTIGATAAGPAAVQAVAPQRTPARPTTA